MGLKAKVEAIIYAAEEPITAEQISVLLKDMVLAQEAEERAKAEAAAQEAGEQASETPAEAVVQGDAVAESETIYAVETPEPTAEAAPENEPAEDEAAAIQESAEGEIVAADSVAESDSEHPAEESGESAQQEHAASESSPEVHVSAEPAAEFAPVPADPRAAEPVEADAQASVTAPDQTVGKRKKPTKKELTEDGRVTVKIRAIIEELISDYQNNEDRGMEIKAVAGGYRMATKAEHHDVVRAFAKSLKPPIKFSLAALETLAVIAYKQPITVPEITEIRGVESGGVIGTLLDRKLITTAGRKQVVGRPILYKTSKEFLLRFGLGGLSDLPSMEEFEKLAHAQEELFTTPAESSEEPAEPTTDPQSEVTEQTAEFSDAQPAVTEAPVSETREETQATEESGSAEPEAVADATPEPNVEPAETSAESASEEPEAANASEKPE